MNEIWDVLWLLALFILVLAPFWFLNRVWIRYTYWKASKKQWEEDE